MALRAPKECEIFSLRAELTPSDETAAAMERVKAHPTDPDAYMELGLCLRRQMFVREAIEAYSIGISYDPFRCLLYRHRGHACVNAGMFAQAAADFETGLRIDPTNWDCWYHLGLAYHLMGMYPRALKAYETCYALAKSDEFRICTADWMCMTLMKMGDLEGMKRVADRIRLDMVPGDSAGYFERCLVYNGTRKADEVLAEAEAMDDHMFATGAYGLAVYYQYVMGDKAKARAILERIAARDETWSGFAEHAAAIDLKNWAD